MRFDVITLFPELFAPHLSLGITRRAFESGQVQLNRVYTCGHDGRGRPQAHMTDQRRRRLVEAGFDWSLLLNPNGWWES